MAADRWCSESRQLGVTRCREVNAPWMRLSIVPIISITTMAEPNHGSTNGPEPVGADELNAWKRGFTPQAEIWNGRLAMIGLSAGLAVVLLVRVFAGG